MSSEPAGFKKGDLEVSVLEGRGLRNGESSSPHCIINLRMNKPEKTQSSKGPDPKWNQSFTLDLLSLNDEELTIKVMDKRTLKDEFIGQVEIPIKALELPAEPLWYYLTDLPSTSKSKKSEKSEKTVVTGEIMIKLTFIHRLKKAVSSVIQSEDHAPSTSSSAPVSLLRSTTSSKIGVATPDSDPKAKPVTSRDATALASAWDSKSGAPGGSLADRSRPKLDRTESNNFTALSHSASQSVVALATFSRTAGAAAATVSKQEEVMIEEALRERQIEVEKKLAQGKALIRQMSVRITAHKGEAGLSDKVAQMESSLKEMEDQFEREKKSKEAELKRERDLRAKEKEAKEKDSKDAEERQVRKSQDKLKKSQSSMIDSKILADQEPRRPLQPSQSQALAIKIPHDLKDEVASSSPEAPHSAGRELDRSGRELDRSGRELDRKLSGGTIEEEDGTPRRERKNRDAKEKERELDRRQRELLLERERSREKDENNRLKSKISALEMKQSLVEQQVESEKKHNDMLARQVTVLELEIKKRDAEDIERSREEKLRMSREDEYRERSFNAEMKIKEMEIKLRDAEREKQNANDITRRMEEDFARKMRDLEDEIIRRDTKERKRTENERDKLAQELLQVEEEGKVHVNREEAAAIKKKKEVMESKLKDIEGALDVLRSKKNQMEVERLEKELAMKEEKLKEGEAILQNALALTAPQDEDEARAHEESKKKIQLLKEKSELDDAKNQVLKRVQNFGDQVQSQLIRQRQLEIMLFEKKVKVMDERLVKMREKEAELMRILKSNNPADLGLDDDFDDFDNSDFVAPQMKTNRSTVDSSQQKERAALDEKRKDLAQKMQELDSEVHNLKKQRQSTLIGVRKNEVSIMESKIEKMGKIAKREREKTQQLRSQSVNMDNVEDEESSEEELGGITSARSNDGESGRPDTPTHGGKQTNRKSKRGTMQIEHLDILFTKLEKLDKLDDLLKKLNNFSGMAGGEDGGRSYEELKKEMEELQKIIFNTEVTQKEREDANIRFEKCFQEFQNTEEYKQELIKAAEDKRKLNEPLNKEALEKMLKIFTPKALKENEEIRERVKNNPELTLIGMDPKMILAKHQNDFAQYFLRLDLLELRAVRASLPKFRRDQKKQSEFVEQLDSKIEAVASAPPKPVRPPAPKKLAAKAPPKKIQKAVQSQVDKGGGTDIFAELLAKRKRVVT